MTVALPDAIVDLAPGSDEIEWWNDAAARFLGFTYPRDSGQRISNLLRSPAFLEYLHQQENYEQGIEMPSPVDEELTLKGRESELYSAFSNLVFNAVRYTAAGGLMVRRYFRSRIPGWAAPHQIPRLTERFYRVDNGRSRSTGGTGLGLAIVKHVLLRHEGWLEIESELDNGSEFRCHFPPGRCSARINRSVGVGGLSQADAGLTAEFK
jgi:signal transduction histidine kinase